MPSVNPNSAPADSGPNSGSAFFGVEHLPLLAVAEMRAWDERTVREHGVPERVLMENAARAAARVVQHCYPHGRVVAVVGKGNNGGDAVVLLRVLRAWGREVLAVRIDNAELPIALLHGHGIPSVEGAEAETAFQAAGVIVDGLLGTGAQGAPRDSYATMIQAMQRAGRPIIALDGPSGIDLTDGSAPGAAVRADITVTFGAPKWGLLRFPGREHAGRIVVAEVGFAPLPADGREAIVVTPPWAHARLPKIPPNAHKGTAGSVGVLAGHVGMAGAAVMVAMGALRTGAGLVRCISPASNRLVIQSGVPEALFVDREGEGLTEALDASDAVVAGPGLGTDNAARTALVAAIEHGAALVLDADAINLLAREPELLGRGGDRPVLLTPHPGEMGRLMDAEVKQVVAEPKRFAAEAAERFGCAVLLKGALSIVAAPGEPTRVNVTGHSGIATGGMGDTLAGIAGTFLAQGCSPADAGALALFYSGRAAEIAGRGRGLLPRDVAQALPQALADHQAAPAPFIPGILLDLPPAR